MHPLACGRAAALLHNALAALLPARCVFCADVVSAGNGLCAGCRADLPWLRSACLRCGEPLAAHEPDGTLCAGCQTAPPPLLATVAPFHYRFPVDIAIRGLKFQRHLHYAPALGQAMAAAVARLPLRPDSVLPVPLHWRRQWRRGYNQALELAQVVAADADLPLLPTRVRRRSTPPQSGLSAAARRANLREAFRVGKIDAVGCHVLIVDDVMTTNSTAASLARALLDAGVGQVSAVVAARAATPR